MTNEVKPQKKAFFQRFMVFLILTIIAFILGLPFIALGAFLQCFFFCR